VCLTSFSVLKGHLRRACVTVGDGLWCADREHEPTDRTWLRFVCVVALIVLLLVLRRTDGVTNPQFWAEDGTVFFQWNLKLGCWQAVQTFFRGFPYLLSKLVACAATPLPFVRVPLAYNVVAYGVAGISLATFSLPNFRHVISSDRLRVIFCLATAALPHATELVGSLTNTSWYLGIWLVLLTVMRLPRSAVSLAAFAFASILATFSTPLSIITLPLWLARGLHAAHGRRWREVVFAGVALGSVFALIGVAGGLGHDPATPTSIWRPLLNSVSLRVLADTALGPPAVSSLASHVGSWVVHPIAITVLLVLAVLMWQTRWRTVPVLVFCAYGIVASSALAVIGHPSLADMAATVDELLAWSRLFSGRYHVLAVSLVYVAVLASIDRLPSRRSRSLATVVALAWLGCTEAATFVLPPFLDLAWPSYAGRLERKLADASPEPLMIPINPDRLGYAFNITLDTRARSPEVGIPADRLLTELRADTTFEQSFIARCRQLSEIDLFLGIAGRPITQTVYVDVRDERTGNVVATSALDASTIVSQLAATRAIAFEKIDRTDALSALLDALHPVRAFYFAPVPDSLDTLYVITVRASGGAPGDAVTIYGSAENTYPGGEARLDGKGIPGDMAFRYGCTRP
jgi:hypothetical protein